jgi:hypothetical protein
MRIKIIAVLFFLGIMSGLAVAQSSTSGSSSGGSSSAAGAGSTSAAGSTGTTGSNSTSGNSGSFLNPSSRGVQVPSTSGIGNVTVNPTTPSTLMFNTQNLNSPSAIDSSSGSPSMDEILSLQNDLVSSSSSSTTNNRTSTSVLGQTIFGNSIVPGMTNVPIVSVVPSTGPLVIGSTNSNPQ